MPGIHCAVPCNPCNPKAVQLAAWQPSTAHRAESRATGERLRVYERRAGLRRGLRLGLHTRLQCTHPPVAPGHSKAGRTLQQHVQDHSITSRPERMQNRICTGTEHDTTACLESWLVVSKGRAHRGERTGERERAPPYEGERDRLRPYGERERSRLPPPPAENPPGSLLTYSTDSVRPALKLGLGCTADKSSVHLHNQPGCRQCSFSKRLTSSHGLIHDTLGRAGGTVQAAEVGALERVRGLVDVLVLHERIVALNLHAHKAAVGLKVALQVALARAVRVKVDHKQCRRRVGLPAPQVLAALHLAIALQARPLEPHALARPSTCTVLREQRADNKRSANTHTRPQQLQAADAAPATSLQKSNRGSTTQSSPLTTPHAGGGAARRALSCIEGARFIHQLSTL